MLCHPRARSGYFSLKRPSKATGARTTFEAKMEGSKAISFKSPARADHSMVVRKLAMTARSRLGDYRKQSTNRQVIIKTRISERCETTDSLPPFLPTLQLKLVCVIERIHGQPQAPTTEP